MRHLLILLFLPFVTVSLYAHPGVDQRLQRLTEQLEQAPLNQSLHIQRGSTYSIDGQFDSALADYRRAEQLGPPQNVAFELGVLYYRKGEFNPARIYFDTTLEHWPTDVAALEYRARLLRDAGAHAGALADLATYFELTAQPKPGHYVAAAQMRRALPDGGIKAAIAILDQGLEKLGLTSTLQKYAVELELEQRQPRQALKRHESLRPLLGKSPDWKVAMGELLVASGEEESAQPWFHAALQQLESLRQTPARQRLHAHVLTLAK